MERKIGEIFEHNGEWYQCVKGDMYDYCKGCPSFENLRCTTLYGNKDCWLKATCEKLEKVGEPHFIKDEIFEGGKVYVQNFKVYEDFEGHKPICNDYIIYDWKNRIISIEIKQNTEDMSNTETLWYGPDKKEAKSLKLSNLKPFSLEAAKAGKPVCTRNGHKARIICFDAKSSKPVIALITRKSDDYEEGYSFYEDGRACGDKNNDYDLMMFPERKEGWVNVYYDNDASSHRGCRYIYDTKEQAIKEDGSAYITTVKINWEE